MNMYQTVRRNMYQTQNNIKKSQITSFQLKKSNQKMANQQHEIPQSLEQKIVEANLRTNDNKYQQLLIQEKQLEIKIYETQEYLQQMMKVYNNEYKKRKASQKILEKLKNDCFRKKQYLEKYYTRLEEKLKGNNGQPLKIKLQKITNLLEKKYQKEQFQMNDMVEKLNIELKKNQTKKEQLSKTKNKLEKLAESIDPKLVNKKQYFRTTSEWQAHMLELQSQLKSLEQNNLQLDKSLKRIDGDIKILKRLLNIEEKHKKHWQIITNGIRTAFDIKLRIQIYKQALGQQYKSTIHEIKNLLDQRLYEKNALQIDLGERSLKLDAVKDNNNKLIENYSTLQKILMDKKNKR